VDEYGATLLNRLFDVAVCNTEELLNVLFSVIPCVNIAILEELGTLCVFFRRNV
jgi:hypothetical protein